VIVYCDKKSAVAAMRVTWAVPLPVSVPAPLITSAAAGMNVPPTVIVVPTLKSPLLDVVPLIVKLMKANVPAFTIEPPAIVIVPEEGLKFAPVPTVRVPPTPKLLDVVTVAEFEIVRSPNASVPEFTIEEPSFIVIAPLVGVNVPVTVNMPPTVAMFDPPVMDPLTFNPPEPADPYVRFDST